MNSPYINYRSHKPVQTGNLDRNVNVVDFFETKEYSISGNEIFDLAENLCNLDRVIFRLFDKLIK